MAHSTRLLQGEKDPVKITAAFNQLAQKIDSGQFPGTSTNDSAAAGNVGEYISAVTPSGTGTNSTVTITNASPAVVSWTGHGMTVGGPVYFTTTGALPTGLSASTRYWVSRQGFGANSFSVSTTVDNALAGTSVNTSSAGSGTHTAFSSLLYALGDSSTLQTLTAISLTAGDWDVAMQAQFVPGASTTTTFIIAGITTVSSALDLSDARFGTFSWPINSAIVTSMSTVVPLCRFSLAATTTIYGVVDWNLGTAGGTINGKLRARRVR